MAAQAHRGRVMLVKEIIKQGNIAFGTSGARGLVSDFTPEIRSAFSAAFLTSNTSYKRVVIGIDNRPSSPEIARYCIAAAQKLGLEVDYYGVLPTPALAYQSMADEIPAIMVTGSHIPFDCNGLKFYRPDGEITKADEQTILNSSVDMPDYAETPLPTVSSHAGKAYIQRYTKVFAENALTGLKVGVYEHSSAGRDFYHKIFKALGAETISLGRSDIKVNSGLLTALPTRDAVLSVLAVPTSSIDISAQVETLPSTYTASDRIQNVTKNDSMVLIEEVIAEPDFILNKIGMQEATVKGINTVDGYRMTLSTGDVIHLRPSGNAPELRCYVESNTKDKSTLLLDKTISCLKGLL